MAILVLIYEKMIYSRFEKIINNLYFKLVNIANIS